MNRASRRAGFTMIEMMVVIAIVGVLTAMVVGNYGSFRSATVATNMAYEAASTVRQAQLYGLGVRVANAPTNPGDTYGVEFSADSSDYSVFRDAGSYDSGGTPPNGRCDDGCDCGGAGSECVEQVRMLQQVKVVGLCAATSASLDTNSLLSYCGFKRLTASFVRPNPESVIRASTSVGGNPTGPAGGIATTDSYAVGGVVIQGGTHCRLVRVYGNGQLSVEGISADEAADTPFATTCNGA